MKRSYLPLPGVIAALALVLLVATAAPISAKDMPQAPFPQALNLELPAPQAAYSASFESFQEARPFFPTTSLPSYYAVHVPILMYHHLQYLNPNADYVWRTLTVAPDQFELQVAYLARQGFHTIYFSTLIAHLRWGAPLPSNPIILTFDDAWRDDYYVAYPILRKYGMVGTFFTPSNYMGCCSYTLTWPMVYEMSAAGMEFGSHSLEHPFLTQQNGYQIWHELVDSKWILERNLGKPVVVFAYPFGAYNEYIWRQVAAAGYGAGASVNAGSWQSMDNIYGLNRTTVPYWESLDYFAYMVWH